MHTYRPHHDFGKTVIHGELSEPPFSTPTLQINVLSDEAVMDQAE
jgi:hypothetical protein